MNFNSFLIESSGDLQAQLKDLLLKVRADHIKNVERMLTDAGATNIVTHDDFTRSDKPKWAIDSVRDFDFYGTFDFASVKMNFKVSKTGNSISIINSEALKTALHNSGHRPVAYLGKAATVDAIKKLMKAQAKS